MSFLKEDNEVAVQADLTNQSAQAAAAVAQKAADSVHNRNTHMREIIENLQRSRKRPHFCQTSACSHTRSEPVMAQLTQLVDRSQPTWSPTQENSQPIGQLPVPDQTPTQVSTAMLRHEREAAIQQVGLLYEAHASLTAIEDTVAKAREACIAFKCNQCLEQAGFNTHEPCITAEQELDHNHPLGVEDAPRQPMHVNALLLVLLVNPPIPEQVLHPITPH
jgi:hypothetical protein